MVSCQRGPTRHAHAWQIGPFWQDTLEIWVTSVHACHSSSLLTHPGGIKQCLVALWAVGLFAVCDIRPKLILISNRANFVSFITYNSIDKSIWKFARSTAVILSCPTEKSKQFDNWNGGRRYREIWVKDAFHVDILYSKTLDSCKCTCRFFYCSYMWIRCISHIIPSDSTLGWYL